MNRLVAIFFLLIATVFAADGIRLSAPGATGMHTNVDQIDLRPTDATLLYNAEVTEFMGLVATRTGHRMYGTDSIAVVAMNPLYDPLTNWKAAVGVVSVTGVTYGGYWNVKADSSGYMRRSALTFTVPANRVGQIVHTDKFGVGIIDTIDEWWTSYADYHDFTNSDLGLVYSNRGCPPVILTTANAIPTIDTVLDSVITTGDTTVDTIIRQWGGNIWDGPDIRYETLYDTTIIRPDTSATEHYNIKFDTLKYDIRFSPMSPEQPGQPRVFGLNNIGRKLDGVFRYRLVFKLARLASLRPDSSEHIIHGRPGTEGPNSLLIRIDSGAVVLTNFPNNPWGGVPFDDDAENDSTCVIIFRQRVDLRDAWRPIDSIFYTLSDTVIYIDTISGFPDTMAAWTDHLVFPPGRPRIVNKADSIVRADVGERGGWQPYQWYWTGYSFLDTLIGTESPMSSLYHLRSGAMIVDGADSTIPLAIVSYSQSKDYNAIRVYLTNGDSDYIGVVDSSILFAFRDIPTQANNGLTKVYLGNMPDSQLTDAGGVLDEAGMTMIRPPIVEGISGTFTDMDELGERMWAIGDPEFPNRLFYSEHQEYYNWAFASNYFRLDEDDNDLAIAIEKTRLGAQEALAVFKRNKIFLVSGYDPEYDLSLDLIAIGTGCISREMCLGHNGAVYFVNNNLDVCRLYGAKIDTISLTVREYMISTLTDTVETYTGGRRRMSAALARPSYSAKDINARIMSYNEYILVLNQGTGNGMAWNTISNTWSRVKFRFGAVPYGTFAYDTISTISLFGENKDIFYFTSQRPFYITDDTSYNDAADTGIVMKYATPEYGDDAHLWEIQRVALTYSSSSGTPVVTMRIMSGGMDTLATTTFTATSNGKPQTGKWGFPRHAGSNLSLQIETDGTGPLSVSNIEFKPRRVGAKRTN